MGKGTRCLTPETKGPCEGGVPPPQGPSEPEPSPQPPDVSSSASALTPEQS